MACGMYWQWTATGRSIGAGRRTHSCCSPQTRQADVPCRNGTAPHSRSPASRMNRPSILKTWRKYNRTASFANAQHSFSQIFICPLTVPNVLGYRFFCVFLCAKISFMNETVITLFGAIDRYWYNKNYLKYFLDKAKGQPVRLKVSSYGGDVAEAVAMSALMAEHGNVTVEFISFNASAATVLAFGAKSIEMHEDGMWLAHKCSLGVDIWGQLNADQLEDTIKELQNKKKSAEAIDLMIAQKYINRSGKSLKEIITLMEEERWMPAAEAKEWGFIDRIIPGTHKKPQVTNEMTDCFTALGLPLPAIDSEEKPEPEGKNLVSQIIDGIKGLFPTGNKTDISNSSNTVMRKEFTFINQILNSEGIEEKDGKMLLTVENLQAINDAVKAANEAKAKAENDLAVANTAKETAENSLTAVVNDLDSLSDSIKNAADNKAKVQVIRDIVSKIPGTGTDSHREANEDNKFADIATDPINSFENE
ncbi:Clp protease ClpP [Bacteroides uniformis]|uniref:Clp protease ClpP n=2 Tax=Bacteroides uniformis TaxID=820 RepID=A0A412SNB0_BACUN|nr:Clp protease ClpP [Bacteroides uniformis]